jgi:hypothetical protein
MFVALAEIIYTLGPRVSIKLGPKSPLKLFDFYPGQAILNVIIQGQQGESRIINILFIFND